MQQVEAVHTGVQTTLKEKAATGSLGASGKTDILTATGNWEKIVGDPDYFQTAYHHAHGADCVYGDMRWAHSSLWYISEANAIAGCEQQINNTA